MEILYNIELGNLEIGVFILELFNNFINSRY